ncbi:MAG: cytochrome C assembly protein [Acidobacteria bacterium]|nr:cytochrome C assembly protein [Acidobacteriota bacterium]
MRERILILLAGIAAGLLAHNLFIILLQLPDERLQGAVFRVIFFHVPDAWTAFLLFFAAMVASILYLATGNLRYDAFAVASTEVGLAFALANLVTGMIWGANIWGTPWTWDARLTSMLIGCLLYAGYLMLRHAVEDPTERAKNAAVLSIIAFADVPIIFFSIRWWRRMLHPEPVVWGGGFMSPDYWRMLFLNWAPLLLLAAVLLAIRMRQEEQQRELEALRRRAHAL